MIGYCRFPAVGATVNQWFPANAQDDSAGAAWALKKSERTEGHKPFISGDLSIV